MKNLIIENKKSILIIIILLILIITLTIFINSRNKNNTLLVNTYVSKLEKGKVKLNNSPCDLDNVLEYNNVPYFNLSNNVFNQLNEEILTEILLRACYQGGFIDYEASINKNILSVALNISYDTDDDLAYLKYKTYNIDTNTNTKISNEELLKIYKLNKEQVENIVFSKLMEYYNYEKKMNYIDNISFNEYLKILDYTPITIDNMNLYIDNKNDLYNFKDYTLSEGMSIDEDFPYITIKFKLN